MPENDGRVVSNFTVQARARAHHDLRRGAADALVLLRDRSHRGVRAAHGQPTRRRSRQHRNPRETTVRELAELIASWPGPVGDRQGAVPRTTDARKPEISRAELLDNWRRSPLEQGCKATSTTSASARSRTPRGRAAQARSRARPDAAAARSSGSPRPGGAGPAGPVGQGMRTRVARAGAGCGTTRPGRSTITSRRGASRRRWDRQGRTRRRVGRRGRGALDGQAQRQERVRQERRSTRRRVEEEGLRSASRIGLVERARPHGDAGRLESPSAAAMSAARSRGSSEASKPSGGAREDHSPV